MPKRGEIYLVNFDPTVGAEIRKTRPALVIQNDIGNRHSQITIVAAITSQLSHLSHPVNVVLKASECGLEQDSLVLLNQIRSVDKVRLVRRLGTVRKATMEQVNRAMELSLGIIEF